MLASAGSGGAADGIPRAIGFSIFSDSASGDRQAGGSVPDATFTTPPGTAEGDFMFVFFGCDHHLNITNDAVKKLGWNLIDAQGDLGTDGQGTYLMYHFAGANEPSTIVFPGINYTEEFGVQGLMAVYRGVNPEHPVAAYEHAIDLPSTERSADITTPTPALNTTVPNCLAIAGLSPDTYIDAPEILAWPEGFTKHNKAVNNPRWPLPYGWANIYYAERPLPMAGDVAASEFRWHQVRGTEHYGGLTFVLALAPQ